MSGCLYLVATPIGNLEDMTFRAVRILQEADEIAAEDTRYSRKLLTHFDIHTSMTSYHEFNKYDKAEVLVQKMSEGRTIALITDAGTPGISDPGEVLVQRCYEAGIPVIPVPGACAAVNALVASGQGTRRFSFEAFLPQDKKERRQVLRELQAETRTIVLYEAPHRLVKTLEELAEVLGDRPVTICKELTKKHESFRKTTLREALEFFQEEEPRGEYVLVIAGKTREEQEQERQAQFEDLSIPEHMAHFLEEGMTEKEAMKAVAQERGIPKREVYQAWLEEKK
ncbi:MAG: 16S rRNA (cytidine(1402)-2'-O)-methyltransferase [Eubacterium sp.]|nr:16S rRNA (cytidine(1402)-2'-O)-methyltransferase [Eubacterium sp.]